MKATLLAAPGAEAAMIKYAIALAVLIILAAVGSWAILPARYLPSNRVRHLRLRLHLRLHPGKGFATAFGLHLRWGRLAALRRSGRIRRSLPLWWRMLVPGEHSVFLGRAHWRHALRVPLEEHVLVMAPPRTFKTAFLADVILRYPGPVIATTTKADVHGLTAAVRARRGPVHVFNPQHIGGAPSTFRWSPVDGCDDPATAIRRADAFAFAVSQKGVEDGTFWSAKASDYLRGYFHAAALAGYDLRAVAAWASGADPEVPEQILAAAGAPQWALTLGELRSEAHKTAATVRMVMTRALAFMADPALAASVLPARGEGFDIPAFLRDAGTVYLIAEATNQDAPVAPLFAAMASEIHYAAAQIGQASASGRLDPPLLMGLDEVTQICPVPLPSWLSDSGGKGIQIVAVVHGEAQLAGRWDDHGRQVVLDTSSVKVFLPGITDTTTRQAASTLCGQTSWKLRGQEHASRHDVATPDMIRQLPAGFGLVIRGGCAPVIARLPRAWNNPAYRRHRRAPRPGGACPSRPFRSPRLRNQSQSQTFPITCPTPGPQATTPPRPSPGADHDRRPDHGGAGPARRPPRAHHHPRCPRSQPLRRSQRPAHPARQHDLHLGPRPGGQHRRPGPGRCPGPPGQRPDHPNRLRRGRRRRLRARPGPGVVEAHPRRTEDAARRTPRLGRAGYRPGYGHLAAALRPCWPEHDLCLYGLDILHQLWSALYLQPQRTTGLLSAQAEYQARILPALAAQLAAETTRCGHRPAPGYPKSSR
jgi:type IV secretion system protein VirD4